METKGLYGEVYLDSKPVAELNERARFALYRYFSNELHQQYAEKAAALIETRLGIRVRRSGPMSVYYDFERLFLQGEIIDVLNSITLIFRTIGTNGTKELWRSFCAQTFRNFNLRYRLTDACEVRLLHDPDFERSTAATLRLLESDKFARSRELFKQCVDELSQVDGSRKDAIRDCFEAIEVVIKDRFPKRERLDRNCILQDVRLLAVEGLDPATSKSVGHYAAAFGSWIDAAHTYRHGQKEPAPSEPGLDYAVALVSAGASFLRWLLSVLD